MTSNIKYGLALSGGGTKGSYQAGAFMALRELGVEISTVVGTSIGAINGAFVAQKDIDKCIELWQNFDVYAEKYLPVSADVKSEYDISSPIGVAEKIIHEGGIDMTPIKKLLEDNINEKAIRTSSIKYGLSTFCLTEFKGTELFINEIPAGKLIDYILASACFPGFKPVEIENNLYIDGGVYNNLPLNMLKKSGCKDVIAVVLNDKEIENRWYNVFDSIRVIRSPLSLGKTFNFSIKDLLYNFDLGWYDTLKSFGMFSGTYYYFSPYDYVSYIKKNSEKKIMLLEKAGIIFGFERVRYITCKQLEQEIIEYFKAKFTNRKRETEPFFDMVKALITGTIKSIKHDEETLLNMCELYLKPEYNLHKKLAIKSYTKEYQIAEMLCRLSGIR